MSTWTNTSKATSSWSPASKSTSTWSTSAKSLGGGLWVSSILPWQLALPWQATSAAISWANNSKSVSAWTTLIKSVGSSIYGIATYGVNKYGNTPTPWSNQTKN